MDMSIVMYETWLWKRGFNKVLALVYSKMFFNIWDSNNNTNTANKFC